ncbi:hypothetical protein KIPB_014692 [Kipferlia bialata]|uniref:Uncharacterized protein n=1 Tax=Kipferlia bialata TaxID=797122 RepID=A0A9K3GPQ4_9EUKA|nr:hypothetical protein KIPB_014692 [Kipferlia bialata]|eukprot:g14692.t1
MADVASVVPKNYSYQCNGGKLHSFSSQYHHESRALNLVMRDHAICWFTSAAEPLPANVVIDMGQQISLNR